MLEFSIFGGKTLDWTIPAEPTAVPLSPSAVPQMTRATAKEERAVWVAYIKDKLRAKNLKKLSVPTCTFVLGPSASGKTFGCKQMMKDE